MKYSLISINLMFLKFLMCILNLRFVNLILWFLIVVWKEGEKENMKMLSWSWIFFFIFKNIKVMWFIFVEKKEGVEEKLIK